MSSGFDVAERARKEMQEIGGKCGNNNKYTHWYSDNVENIGYNFWWCAAFVSYVVRQCGVPTSIVPKKRQTSFETSSYKWYIYTSRRRYISA